MSNKITFTEPWGPKSWKVTYSGSYSNDRPPHVETTSTGLAKKSFTLGKRRVKKKYGNVIVMYEIPGLRLDNGQKTAHITVYFGSEEHAAAY